MDGGENVTNHDAECEQRDLPVTLEREYRDPPVKTREASRIANSSTFPPRDIRVRAVAGGVLVVQA